MPWRPIISLLHINIHSLDIQGNPLLSIAGSGATFISQSNSQHSQTHPAFQEPQNGACYQSSDAPVLRRVEAQMRIRRKLDEACGHPGSVYGIDNVAQVATSILSIVEVFSLSGTPFCLSESLKYLFIFFLGSICICFQFVLDGPSHECACYGIYHPHIIPIPLR